MPAVAIVFDLPAQLVLARNAARVERVVDPRIVADHLARLRLLVDSRTIEAEGFMAVHRFADPIDLECVAIERLSPERSNQPR